MPELPEVETVARQLNPHVKGRILQDLQIFDRAKLRLAKKKLCGARVLDVFRVGKQVVLAFKPQNYLGVHLRMTGRLLWLEASEVTPQYSRACWTFEHGRLFFVDVRRFGTLTLSESLESFNPRGFDPCADEFKLETLNHLLSTTKQPLKSFLMRQDKIVGIGNIYASEILYAASLSPLKMTSELSPSEVRRLYQQIRRILNLAIRHCGTTFSDFQHTNGKLGSYQKYLHVYKKEGRPCTRCGSVIERLVQAQRSTFFCPACQG